MRTSFITNGAIPVLLAMSTAVIAAGGDFGKSEYEVSCAGCHGIQGKGDGPYVAALRTTIPDLTTIALRNGGPFPSTRVQDTIDGRLMIDAHQSRDMPTWGQVYKVRAGEHYVEVPYDPEAFVQSRTLALSEYVRRLQVK